jgi:hypothetical protein
MVARFSWNNRSNTLTAYNKITMNSNISFERTLRKRRTVAPISDSVIVLMRLWLMGLKPGRVRTAYLLGA